MASFTSDRDSRPRYRATQRFSALVGLDEPVRGSIAKEYGAAQMPSLERKVQRSSWLAVTFQQPVEPARPRVEPPFDRTHEDLLIANELVGVDPVASFLDGREAVEHMFVPACRRLHLAG